MTHAIAARFLRFTGRFDDLPQSDQRLLLDRTLHETEASIRTDVAEIIARVRDEGDVALREFARRFDGVELQAIEVPGDIVKQSASSISPALLRAIERSARNIRAFHAALPPEQYEVLVEPGVVVGRRPDPFQRVGVYAPGGRAAYPSSVLMGAIPARIAGCGEVILCSPPGPGGIPSREVLAAAAIAGVDRVFSLGGAGAIAAMCVGSQSVPRCDKVVGPGNAYVAEAKLQLARFAAFDSPAGPSELMVIADEAADADAIALEVVAQAEHDPSAIVIVLCIGEIISSRVEAALETASAAASRGATVAAALAAFGGILLVDSTEHAVTIANRFAPEHLLIATRDPETVLAGVRNAGAVFIGQSSSVAFGDYMTGGNHVLPTGGSARSYSGLSTLDFVRWTSYQRIGSDGADALADDVSVLAEAEGLYGHAAAARGQAAVAS